MGNQTLALKMCIRDRIYITTGGSEALAITLQCILDDGDEILIPEPFYPNYNTMVRTCGASITPIPTCPEEGYHYAEREKIEPLINEHTRAIMVTNPGNPTGVVLTDDEMKMLVDLAKTVSYTHLSSSSIKRTSSFLTVMERTPALSTSRSPLTAVTSAGRFVPGISTRSPARMGRDGAGIGSRDSSRTPARSRAALSSETISTRFSFIACRCV